MCTDMYAEMYAKIYAVICAEMYIEMYAEMYAKIYAVICADAPRWRGYSQPQPHNPPSEIRSSWMEHSLPYSAWI